MNAKKNTKTSTGQLFGGLLLVTGTCIGGGMLGLPVDTAPAGLIPSFLTYLIAWGLMTITALFMLRILVHLKKEANLVTMATNTLGRIGEAIAWGLYLFLFYSLVVAYSKAIIDLVSNFTPYLYAIFIYLIFIVGTMQLGPKFVTRCNSMLVLGLFVSFIFLIGLATPYVEFDRLIRMNWSLSLRSLPLVITSFGFQGVVPILYIYFKGDESQIRKAILSGSLLSFFLYVIWQWIILGAVPIEGAMGLQAARLQDKLATWALQGQTGDPRISLIGQGLSFFAITSSLLGVGVGLIDFLLDGFHLSKGWKNRFLTSAFTFIPAALIATTGETIFYFALTYGGGLGCTLLLAALPTVMLWVLRRKKGKDYQPIFLEAYPVLALAFGLCLLTITTFFLKSN